jgi:threonine dehydratase
VVVPTGDGNILAGIWKGFCDLKEAGIVDRTPKMLCAQSEESAAIGAAVWKLQKAGGALPDWKTVEIAPVAATTVADSISVDIPRDGLAAVRAVIESGGAAVAVPDAEILAAIPELARGAGVFAEPAASCAWAGLKKAARRRDREAGRDGGLHVHRQRAEGRGQRAEGGGRAKSAKTAAWLFHSAYSFRFPCPLSSDLASPTIGHRPSSSPPRARFRST